MKKGFTLIELLAVIIILGLVLLIVVPNVTKILNRTQTRLNTEQKAAVENAARQWGVSNLIYTDGKITYNGEEKNYVTIDELQTSGFLEDKEIQDMTDREKLEGDTKVCIIYKNNQFIYEFDGEC